MSFITRIFARPQAQQQQQPSQVQQSAPAPDPQSAGLDTPQRRVRRRAGTQTKFGGLSTSDQAQAAKKTLLGE